MVGQIVPRLGGRSARVREAVLRAASDLSNERGEAQVTMADIAARSGVHSTSLYRRWGTAGAVVLDAALERQATEAPLPDTGSLRGDLVAYAIQASRGLAEPGGLRLLQAVLAAAGTRPEAGEDRRRRYLDRRADAIQQLLDRAAARGEVALHWSDVTDGILAPLYLRRLFDVEVEDELAERLVTRVLAGTVPRCSPGAVSHNGSDADTEAQE